MKVLKNTVMSNSYKKFIFPIIMVKKFAMYKLKNKHSTTKELR